jgi:hypothetical protein
MLCRICIDVLEHRTNNVHKSEDAKPPRVTFTHHFNISTLSASAAEYCYVCRSVWNQFSEVEQAALRLAYDKVNERENATLGFEGVTRITLFTEMPDNGHYHFYVEYCRYDIDWGFVSTKSALMTYFNLDPVTSMFPIPATMPDCKANELVAEAQPRLYRMRRADNTASEESWSLATGWLRLCLTTHKICNKGRDTEWYPTRLLDVGEADDAQRSVRLIHSTGAPISGGYCTLSHRWGAHVNLQLNQRTADVLIGGVATEDLPRTFRDAVVATRRFGVRYLWIDSLCIMQDQISDWLHEASRMYLVYSNSYCNFSAAASSDSSQGLFRDRRPELLQPAQVSLYVQDIGSQHAYAPCNVFLASFWDDNVSNCVVNKRGWVSASYLCRKPLELGY